MNEIVNIGVNSISNNELRIATKTILTIMAQNEKNTFKVAVKLADVMEQGLWKDDFEKLGDYTEKFFNVKQAQAYNLKRVVDRFFAIGDDGKVKPESRFVTEKYGDFSVTKLLRLAPVDDETIDSWIEQEIVTPVMSVKEIEELVKAWQDEQQTADEEQTEPEETADDIAEEAEITEHDALEVFNKAYETLKMMLVEFNFDKMDKQVELINGYANANF